MQQQNQFYVFFSKTGKLKILKIEDVKMHNRNFRRIKDVSTIMRYGNEFRNFRVHLRIRNVLRGGDNFSWTFVQPLQGTFYCIFIKKTLMC